MGVGYPLYHIDPIYIDKILGILKGVIQAYFKQNIEQYTWRPLRPEELTIGVAGVTAMQIASRTYITTCAKAVTQGILGAAAANAIRIPPGSVYVIIGWMVVDPDPTTPTLVPATGPGNAGGIVTSEDCNIQVLVNGAVKQECNMMLCSLSPNHMLIQLDQVVIAEPDTILTINIQSQAAWAAAWGPLVVFPLGFRIATQAQLNNG